MTLIEYTVITIERNQINIGESVRLYLEKLEHGKGEGTRERR